VKRRYRVREDRRFREIRQRGRSYSNDLLVLCALPNELPFCRFGFSVNSRVGKAVARNRIKRRLREIMRLRMASIRPGWDIILIARKPIRSAEYLQLETACARLLRRAQLLLEEEQALAPGQ
jgi:ribonuclease P protein component